MSYLRKKMVRWESGRAIPTEVNEKPPGFKQMTRAKRTAEVMEFREDLRRAEVRRNYLLEMGNIRSALFDKQSPGVQHRLHNRRDELESMLLDSLK